MEETIFDEFVRFAKDHYDLNIVKATNGKGLSFNDIFGVNDYITLVETT